MSYEIFIHENDELAAGGSHVDFNSLYSHCRVGLVFIPYCKLILLLSSSLGKHIFLEFLTFPNHTNLKFWFLGFDAGICHNLEIYDNPTAVIEVNKQGQIFVGVVKLS